MMLTSRFMNICPGVDHPAMPSEVILEPESLDLSQAPLKTSKKAPAEDNSASFNQSFPGAIEQRCSRWTSHKPMVLVAALSTRKTQLWNETLEPFGLCSA